METTEIYYNVMSAPNTDNEYVFHNVALILNKTMSGNNCF